MRKAVADDCKVSLVCGAVVNVTWIKAGTHFPFEENQYFTVVLQLWLWLLM